MIFGHTSPKILAKLLNYSETLSKRLKFIYIINHN